MLSPLFLTQIRSALQAKTKRKRKLGEDLRSLVMQTKNLKRRHQAKKSLCRMQEEWPRRLNTGNNNKLADDFTKVSF